MSERAIVARNKYCVTRGSGSCIRVISESITIKPKNTPRSFQLPRGVNMALVVSPNDKSSGPNANLNP